MPRGKYSKLVKIMVALSALTASALLLSLSYPRAGSVAAVEAEPVASMLYPIDAAKPSHSPAERPAGAFSKVEANMEQEAHYDEPVPALWEPIEEIPLSAEFQQILYDSCQKYGLEIPLALGIIERESSFDPEARNGPCAGLMQIHQINYAWLHEEGIDPLTYGGNIEAGVLIISRLLEKYGDVHLALMAYNCGETGARRLWDQGIYSSKYSRWIIVASEKWQGILEKGA